MSDDVHRRALPAEQIRLVQVHSEVGVLDEQIGGDDQKPVTRADERGVVTDPERKIAHAGRAVFLAYQLDQGGFPAEFGDFHSSYQCSAVSPLSWG